MPKLIAPLLALVRAAAPSNPPSGQRALYPKADGWYDLDSSGVENVVAMGARLGSAVQVVTDWNNATSDGFYGSSNTATNAPIAQFLNGYVVAATSTYLTQTVWDYVNTNSTNAVAYRRQRVGGSWSSWYKVPISPGDVTTVANEVPSYASNRLNPFDPATSFYNLTETSTQRLRSYLSKSGTQRVKIGLVGHSIIAGSFTSAVGSYDIASQIRRYLSAEQSNVNGTGFAYVENKVGTSPALGRDARWTSITGWTPANAINSMWASTTTNNATATFVADAPGSIVDVLLLDVVGNTCFVDIYVDGILKDTYQGGAQNNSVLRSITGLANAKHTVDVVYRTGTGATGYLVGARVRNATGLEVSNHGQGGSDIRQWLSTGTYSQNFNVADAAARQEIAIVALGDGNEIFQSVSVATAKAAFQTMISDYQTLYGTAVVLMTAPAMVPAGGAYATLTFAQWDPYVSMLYDLADQYDVPLLDTRHFFVNYAAANGLTWMGDNIHPNDTGHAVIARLLATNLLKVIPYDTKPDALLEEYPINPPSAPATGLKFYTKYGSRRLPAFIAAGGQSSALQPALFANKSVWCQAINASTTLETSGALFTVLNNATSTATAVTMASTDAFTEHVRFRVASTAVSTTSGGLRTGSAQWFLSSTAARGGFFYVARLGFNASVANNRVFCGMSSTTAALGFTVDPSALLNQIGFGADSADTNLFVMHNDGSGTSTKISLGANFPCDTSATDFYEMRLYAPPGGGQFFEYWIRRENTGHVASGKVTSSDMPAVGTLLAAHIVHGNGVTASQVSTDIQSLYIESDN